MSGAHGAVAWTYWENRPGRQRSAYLDLCLETIARHAPPLELRCLSVDDTPALLPDLDVERWRALPAPNYRSDYVRSRVLERYGGIWIDIDTIALAPLTGLLDELDDTGTVCFGREVGRFFGGLCAAAPGSPFMRRWAEEQDKALDRCADWSTMNYAALAQDVTWHIARDIPWKALPMARVAPIPWFQWRRFFSRVESPRRVLGGAPITVVLWNAVMAPTLRPMDHEALLRSRMLVCRLLRIGLGRSAPDEEDGPL
ncbi:MAG TPA: glycosyltransferase, partial [Acidimicrobiales bacterium]|nr:glycosyltransferase [Acidimicrobiales bacterium]